MMNRNRQGGRDRSGGRFMGNMGNMGGGGLGDGLLGEGPGMGGGYPDQMMNQQLILAQSLLQQQQALNQQVGLGLGGGHGGPDFHGMGDPMGSVGHLAGAMGNLQFMQQNRALHMASRMGGAGGMGGGGGGGGRMHDMGDRKRMGQGRDRNVDAKRRRHDSSGRGGERDSRSRTRDNNRGGDGRDRNRSSRWDTDTKNGGNDDYDPAEPTDADDVGGGRDSSHKNGDGNLYCHVCNISVYDDESFRRHLNGTKHATRMNSLLTMHEMKSNQLKSRLKAEEHLRNIERKGGRDPDFFCKICNNDLTLPWKRHCFSNIHKQRLLQVRRGCGWCNVHNFTNFTEVLQHRETEQHKKNAEVHGKKDKEDKEKRDKEKPRSKSKDVKSEKGDTDRKEKKAKAKEEEEDLTIPEYDPETPVGLNYIIPVTGFFCKLCHKFYNNEKSAKGAHCQSEPHYEKLKLALEAKIEAREKRRAEEAEEEAKRKEEEEMRRQEEEGGEDDEMKEEILEEEEEEGKNEQEEKEMEDTEDYDDELPLEDEDGEGGNIPNSVDDDGGLLQLDKTGSEAFLDDTNADASFEFLSGDMVQAHLELQKAEQMIMTRQKGKEVKEDEDLVLEEGLEEDVTPVASGADDSDLLGDTPSQASSESANPSTADTSVSQEVELVPEPVPEPVPVPEETPVVVKATAKRGTARRGRGRGRARK